MKAEDGEADAVEGGFGGGQLLQDFHAQARFLDHPANAADLSLDAVQTGDDSLLLCLVEHDVLSMGCAAPDTIP